MSSGTWPYSEIRQIRKTGRACLLCWLWKPDAFYPQFGGECAASKPMDRKREALEVCDKFVPVVQTEYTQDEKAKAKQVRDLQKKSKDSQAVWPGDFFSAIKGDLELLDQRFKDKEKDIPEEVYWLVRSIAIYILAKEANHD